VNTSYRPWMVVALAAGLASCAGGMQKSSYVPAHAIDRSSGVSREDTAYMARVEDIARKRGVNVHWVNPPRKVQTLADQQ